VTARGSITGDVTSGENASSASADLGSRFPFGLGVSASVVRAPASAADARSGDVSAPSTGWSAARGVDGVDGSTGRAPPATAGSFAAASAGPELCTTSRPSEVVSSARCGADCALDV